MITFREYLCPCTLCESYETKLLDESLDKPFDPKDFSLFEAAAARYSNRFSIKIQDIPGPILQLIFDRPFD